MRELTREEIERYRLDLREAVSDHYSSIDDPTREVHWVKIDALCDAALTARSEGFREGVEASARVCDEIAEEHGELGGVDLSEGAAQCAEAIRTLSPRETDAEGECCCAIHHPNYGRCLQCPIHGTPPPPERS